MMLPSSSSLLQVRRHCRRALLLGLALAAGAAFGDTEATISESQIKAAFLYNFTKFVEWPPGTFLTKHHPIVIGILGESELTADLQAIVAGRKVNGRAILVKNVETESEATSIQLLFVREAADDRFSALQTSIQDSAVLTVGESRTFATAGGAILFVERDGKLRFEINMTSAEHARLKVSAELQKLAAAVRRSP